MSKPTPEQMAAFHARVRRDLAFYRECVRRLDDHTPLGVGTARVVKPLETLDEYLSLPVAGLRPDQVAAIGTAIDVAEIGHKRLRGVNGPAT